MRPLRTLARALLLLAAAAAAGAERPPEPAPPKPFPLHARSDVALDNGLKLTMVTLGTVPKATIEVVLRTGSIDEGTHNGLADFAGDYLKEGAGSRTAEQLAAAAADMGGALSVSVGADETTIALDVLSEQVPDAVALIADVLRKPRLPAEELPRLRANALRAVAVARTQAQTQAAEAFNHALWGNHPYGRGLPTERDIRGYRLEDVRQFVDANFGAARTHVYVAGIYEAARTEQAVRVAFGGWKPGPAPTVNVPKGSRRHQVLVIDRPRAPQSTILLGLPSIDPSQPDYVPLSVATTLYGGGLLSRLDQDLREKRGWTYGLSARNAPSYGTGTWSVEGDVTTLHTTESVAEILRQIKRLQQEAPPAQELKLTQNYRAGLFLVGAASRTGVIGQLAFLDLYGLPQDWFSNYTARVYGVTPAEVSGVFARRLPTAEMTVVVVGDKTSFERSLRRLPELSAATTHWTVIPATPAAAPRPSSAGHP